MKVIKPSQCPKHSKCSAPLCPLDRDWQKRKMIKEDRVCFYLSEASKPGANARFENRKDKAIYLVVRSRMPFMKKHNKMVARELMQAAYDRNPDEYDESWDELVVNNFDIKHLYIYRNHSFYSDFITAFFPREKTWVSEIETNPDVLLSINRMMMALAKKYKFTFSYHDTASEFTRAVGDARRRGEIRGSVR